MDAVSVVVPLGRRALPRSQVVSCLGSSGIILFNNNSFSVLLLGAPVWSSQQSCTGVESKFSDALLPWG